MNMSTITGVGTAAGTKKYTIQMWILGLNFTGTNFKGITATWNNHARIDIVESGGTYSFHCYPYWDGTAAYNAYRMNLTFTNNAWNFVSCAAAHELNVHYANTEADEDDGAYAGAKPTLNSDSGTFVLADKSTNVYGHLFIRQIRLWQDAYNTVDYLSRM